MPSAAARALAHGVLLLAQLNALRVLVLARLFALGLHAQAARQKAGAGAQLARRGGARGGHRGGRRRRLDRGRRWRRSGCTAWAARIKAADSGAEAGDQGAIGRWALVAKFTIARRRRARPGGPAAQGGRILGSMPNPLQPPLARVQRGLRQLGPGLITGAADDDPSGIATYSQAGAQYGMNML